ncbi:MAG TPA: TlpA disulfide reductase family protein [Gemmatimonadales bacterium]|nr:TlpA disulfide reductase family protein [Gemmatimonadales bacterium]
MTRWLYLGAVLGGLLGGPTSAWGQESGLPVGSRAPAVVVKDLDGKPVDLGSYLGRQPVLLEFWATWCEVCEALLPTVEAAHRAYGDRVAFFGVNVTVNQTPERVRKYVDSRHPPFRTLYDADGDAVRAYAAPTTSYIVIVDRAGTVRYTGTGASQDLAAVLRTVAAP